MVNPVSKRIKNSARVLKLRFLTKLWKYSFLLNACVLSSCISGVSHGRAETVFYVGPREFISANLNLHEFVRCLRLLGARVNSSYVSLTNWKLHRVTGPFLGF